MKYNSENVDKQFEQNSAKHGPRKEWSDSDYNMLHHIRALYGDTMSAKGLNLLDPIFTNIFHYNKLQVRGQTDYPRVTRTYCFFTRPELNFSYENIQAIPFFQWVYSKPIGKMVMSCLTDPEYFINAPGALNGNSTLGYADIRGIIKEFSNLARKSDLEMESDVGVSDKPANFDISGTEAEEAQAAAELGSVDLNQVGEDTAFAALEDQIKSLGLEKRYNELNSSYVDTITKLNGKQDEIDSLSKTQNVGLYQGKNIMRSFGHSGLENEKNSPYRFNFTSPFIPMLGNTCTELTGARDLSLESYEYEEDEFMGKQTVATGMDGVWGSGTFTSTHEDINYGPVSILFLLWEFYIHYVSRGYITTTRDHIKERILDYTCSAYVFVVGSDGRTIERMGKYTGCYPTSFPLSSQIEHHTQVDEAMLQKISITWQYNRYEPMNPEIFTDFNFLSESEWLFKLKNWDDMYNRDVVPNSASFLDALNSEKNNVSKSALYNAGRDPSIWSTVDEPGMSGQLPRALINGTDLEPGISHSDILNNYWGGYPYINNGSELIWVLPKWKSRQDNAPNVQTKKAIIENSASFDSITTAKTDSTDENEDPTAMHYVNKG